MKRVKKRSAACRKKKKAEEESQKKNEDALLKHFNRVGLTISETVEVFKSKSSAKAKDLSVFPISTLSTNKAYEENIPRPAPNKIDIKDFWPSEISDDTRIFLVRQGASVFQNLKSDFGEISHQGESTKGQSRKLMWKWVFKTLPSGKRILTSLMVYYSFKKTQNYVCCKMFTTEETQKIILRRNSTKGNLEYPEKREIGKKMTSRFSSFKFTLFVCLISVLASYAVSVQAVKADRNLKTRRVGVKPQPQWTDLESELDELDYDLADFEPEETVPEKHPCQRTCKEGEIMTCRYNFKIEYYYTMSKACYNCPFNMTDCNLKHCVPGDGVKRTILSVNRQLPGPSIDVCYGDTVEVELENKMLDVSTTIHWHGLFQKETPFMDGVPFVSQCLVGPQSTFLYRFYADNPGTHLWHSHSALQRGDGIYGPLIIRVPVEEDLHSNLYDFDLPEHVITTLDWNHELSVDKFVSHYHSRGDNKPASILVNGKGRYKEFEDDENVIFTPAEKFTVKAGYRYRFRMINAGFLNCPLEITIDKHNITVIASDGGDLQPVETETLVTAAGERFDFILEANQEIGNYWIRFRGLLDGAVKNAFQVAILHYEGAEENTDPEGDATYESSVATGFKVNAVNTPAETENALIMSELEALYGEEDPALKATPDMKFFLPFDFYPVENIHYKYPIYSSNHKKSTTPQINHISMQFPNFPLMADLARSNSLGFCNASSVSLDCRFEFCECPHVLEIPLDAVVELILIDEGVPFNANHPFHLHGYTFKLIGMDRLGEKTSEEEVRRLDEAGMLKRNLKNPPVKDTVAIPDGGYAILRFHATNPGFWILHCHLDFHVELGMALLFKVGDDVDFKAPPENFPVCGNAFQPIPVNQTMKNAARFFPSKGIHNNNESLISASKTSQLKFPSVFAFVLFLFILR